MNIKLLFTGILFLFAVLIIQAQVTIGFGTPPNAGALLDLKEYNDDTALAGGRTATKGLGLPRVKLISKAIPTGGNLAQTIFGTDPSDVWDKDEHIGLTVYNMGGCSSGVNTGVYTWTGTTWHPLFEIPNTSFPSDGSRMQDSLALVAIYDATNGDEWTNKLNWKTDKPMSEWHGVTLTADACETRVTELRLPGNNVDGDIPAAIGDLSRLTHVDFSNPFGSLALNYIKNVTIGNDKLNALVYFSMAYVETTENFTVGNNSLNALIKLNLDHSHSIKTFTVGDYSLNALPDFDMTESHYTYFSTLDMSIGDYSLNSTRNFKYNTTNLVGTSSPTLSIGMGSLINASIVTIGGVWNNLLTEISIGNGSFTNVNDLTLSRTTLDDIPYAIRSLVNLKYLTLEGNVFVNLTIGTSNLPNLETLVITANPLLKTLSIESNSLTALKIFTLESPILETLTISDGSLNALTNLGMNNTVPFLKDISIGNNCLNTLTGFYFNNSELNTISSGIGSLSNLTRLGLDNNKLVGAIPAWIANLTYLTYLNLSKNQLSGTVPDNILGSAICPQYVEGTTNQVNNHPWTNFTCPLAP